MRSASLSGRACSASLVTDDIVLMIGYEVEEGATVDLSVENGRLLVRPLRVRKHSLNVLLRNVTRRNLHGEVSTGRAVGREAW